MSREASILIGAAVLAAATVFAVIYGLWRRHQIATAQRVLRKRGWPVPNTVITNTCNFRVCVKFRVHSGEAAIHVCPDGRHYLLSFIGDNNRVEWTRDTQGAPAELWSDNLTYAAFRAIVDQYALVDQ